MYTTYTNNYDISHVAYPKGQTLEEQWAEWAIFATLTHPLEYFTTPISSRTQTAPEDLHTYTTKPINSSLLLTSTTIEPTLQAPFPHPQ